ncbi:MAG: DUF255 domain-containing protein [candidate division Zixibacteria bacterium]|nr:DUF255 domain-containing protein [candidate division Zixibacteria bacterium]
MKKSIITVLILFCFLITGFSFAGDKPVKNSKNSAKKVLNSTNSDKDILTWVRYDEGMKLAKASGKKVFLEFTTTWCGWCKKMHATTFKDPKVIELLNNYFVTISVDGDSRDSLNVDGFITTEKGVTREYGVSSYPTYWFLESDGGKIAPMKGYKDRNVLEDILDYLKDDTYKTVEFGEFLAKKKEDAKKTP